MTVVMDYIIMMTAGGYEWVAAQKVILMVSALHTGESKANTL
jgi:hypothetical protein